MTTYTTYHSTTAKPSEAWVAYVNNFKVFCFGATEQEAKDGAKAFYDKMRSHVPEQPLDDTEITAGAPKPGSGHGNAGKIWMRHAEHGLQRVPMTEITMREVQGWYRSGPRGK